MKKYLIFLLLFITIGIVGYLTIEIFTMIHKKSSNETTYQSLDNFYHQLGIVGPSNNQSTMVIYFSSHCDHCLWQITEIANHKPQFKNVNLTFISLDTTEDAKGFLAVYGLEKHYKVVEPEKILDTISKGIPQLFVYNSERVLLQHFKGGVKLDLLLSLLHNPDSINTFPTN